MGCMYVEQTMRMYQENTGDLSNQFEGEYFLRWPGKHRFHEDISLNSVCFYSTLSMLGLYFVQSTRTQSFLKII